MECRQCMERLSEYLDGELNANDYMNLEAHLQCCPDCRMVMDELASVKKEISLSIASVPLPVNLSKQIISVLEKEQHNDVKDIWLTSILLAVFASPLLLVFTRTFSSVLHLIYTTWSAFWRSIMTFSLVFSPWVTVSIGILSLFFMAMGLYIIKILLTRFECNGVVL